MATNNEPAKISCPCCQATLVIDRETLAILYVTEPPVIHDDVVDADRLDFPPQA